MQLDPGAVTQIARAYHGYYPVKGGTTSHVLRFDNDFQEDGGSSLEINCAKGIIMIRLRTPHRGKSEVVRQNADYNTLHQVSIARCQHRSEQLACRCLRTQGVSSYLPLSSPSAAAPESCLVRVEMMGLLCLLSVLTRTQPRLP